MDRFGIRFDAGLIRRYERPGPRYTSYPTALQFSERFGAAEYQAAVAASNEDPLPRPLSLYVHVPFCASPCFYCACTRVISRNHEKAEAYLYRLHREIELQGRLYDRDRTLEQLHFGGGTPTFLTTLEIGHLVDSMARHFSLSPAASREFSIEIDPRTVTRDTLRDLVQIGFNRSSLGVQDFDPLVQAAVNRVQAAPATLKLIRDAQELGFASVSVDLIYGLPRQTTEGFSRTLDAVLSARPSRFAVYAYAHLPRMFKAQRQIDAGQLPGPETRLELLGLTIDKLTAAGYVYVGMDHFALPGDELVLAQHAGHLHRNFQGYSTRGHCDLIGLGMSSVGRIGDAYAQNLKTLPEYYGALDRGRLPVYRGVALTADDILRRDVIQQIMCHGALDFEATGHRHRIDFGRYFATELRAIAPLVDDGLAEFMESGLRVLPRGRLLLRNVAMAFDAYLSPGDESRSGYSKAI